jgi:hypothetical protein
MLLNVSQKIKTFICLFFFFFSLSYITLVCFSKNGIFYYDDDYITKTSE